MVNISNSVTVCRYHNFMPKGWLKEVEVDEDELVEAMNDREKKREAA
jgi:hypothetical protein